ncbi:M20/M25/M40 family metallo-hydrolase [Aliikangiella sp. IMCC44653]
MIAKSLLISLPLAVFSFLSVASSSKPPLATISQSAVLKDIQTLASDKMQGRAAFTPEIDQAAAYISERFQSIGLKPLAGESSFLQSFEIFKLSVESKKVTLNTAPIKPENIFILTNQTKQSFTHATLSQVETISDQQDFRKRMAEINQLKHDVLVLVSSKHQKVFSQYQQYFERGLTKFDINTANSAVVVLTDNTEVTQLSVEFSFQHQALALSNVVGVLKGQSKPEEMVLFSAHYDHVGTNPKLEGDTIYNGADDDASGTAAVINLAEYYSKLNNNARSLVFVAFTAEEIGGYGSQYFSKQLDPNQVIAMINLEMIGKPSKFGKGATWMTGYDRSNLAQLMNQHLADSQIHPDPYPTQNLFYRSDNATLARLGVPAHSFSASQIDIDPHYHQVSDEVETLDIESMTKVIQTIAQAAYGIIAAKQTPTRVSTEEIKPQGNFY